MSNDIATETKKESQLTFPEIPVRVDLGNIEAPNTAVKGLNPSAKSLKVAIAQISTYPGQFKFNIEKILSCIDKARSAGAEVVVFPEEALNSYLSMDLRFRKDFLVDIERALDTVRKMTHGITVILGFTSSEKDKVRPGDRPLLRNSAAVIQDGKIVHIQDKTLLPNYSIFSEVRYFAESRGSKVIDINGVKVGIEICEDLWAENYSINPTDELTKQGAELVINLSASPFQIGKLATRHSLIQSTSKNHGVPFIYTNLVGAYDGYEGDVVFDGRSMVFGPKGDLTAIGTAFKEELLIVDAFVEKKLALPECPEVEELYEALVLGIKDYFHRIELSDSGKSKKQAIIGLSGGIDSALVAALAVEALGSDRVLGITMPSEFSSSETKGDAEILAKNLGIKFKTTPIQKPYKVLLETLKQDPDLADLPFGVSEENIQARVRMVDLMYYANALNGIVLNTGNKTELATNNCTIYGDMVGGFGVLADVDKDRVYALSRYINLRARREIIPQTTIDRIPTAELKPGQTDAHVMGAEPVVIAPLVREIVENNLSLVEALDKFKGRFTETLIRATYRKLDWSEWKRRQASPGIRVTPVAFGHGRRMPTNHGYDS